MEERDVTAVDFAAFEPELADPLAPSPVMPLDDASIHFLREAFAQTSSRWGLISWRAADWTPLAN